MSDQRPRGESPSNLPHDPRASFDPRKTIMEVQPGEACAPSPPDGKRYQLLRRFASGGFGEVWEALQVTLGRTVAIKQLRADRLKELDEYPESKQYLEALFRQEARIASRLEHPNIVPIHELGTGEDGRAQLAMKLVRGSAWDHAIDADFPKMPVTDFLARHLPILISVAQAVAFAHSRGVVHRDLKPSQVIVGEFGEVLLLDWGLAHVFDSQALGRGIESGAMPPSDSSTASTNPAGTAAFMAPEQTERTVGRIGPWTDVFLLGGILYYLLTGTPPHDDEDSRIVFTRAMLGHVADPRTRRPERTNPPELEALAMRALAAEPEARVSSAMEFIAGLSDYLSGASRRREATELIVETARRLRDEPRTYASLTESAAGLARARGLWPENEVAKALSQRIAAAHATAALGFGDLELARTQVALLDPGECREQIEGKIASEDSRRLRALRQRRVAIMAASVFGAGLLAGGVFYTNAQREARLRIERASEEVAAQRDRGEALLSFLVRDLSEKLSSVGRLDLMREVSQRSLDYYRASTTPDVGGESLLLRIRAFTTLGSVFVSEGDLRSALTAAETALGIIDRLPAATADSREGRLARVTAYSLRANIRWYRGEYDAAYADALAARVPHFGNETVEEPPAGEESIYATVLTLAGEYEGMKGRAGASMEFLRAAEHALTGTALSPQGVSLLVRVRRAIAEQHARLGDLNASDASYRAALETVERLLAEDPHNRSALRQWGEVHVSRGMVSSGRGTTNEAIASFRMAVDAYTTLVDFDGRNVLWRYELGAALGNLAAEYQRSGDLDGASEAATSATALLDLVSASDPENMQWARGAADARVARGFTEVLKGDAPAAIASYKLAEPVLSQLVQRYPDSMDFLSSLAGVRARLGDAYMVVGDDANAVRAHASAVEAHSMAVALAPEDRHERRRLGTAVNKLGMAVQLSGDLPAAHRRSVESLRIFEDLSRDAVGDVGLLRETAAAAIRVSMTALVLGNGEEALRAADQALAIQSDYAAEDNVGFIRERCLAMQTRAAVLRALGREEELAAAFDAWSAEVQAATTQYPSQIPFAADWVRVLTARADMAIEAGDPEAALADLDEAEAVFAPLAEASLKDRSVPLYFARMSYLRAIASQPIDRALLEQVRAKLAELHAQRFDIGTAELYVRVLLALERKDEASPVIRRLAELRFGEPVFWKQVVARGVERPIVQP